METKIKEIISSVFEVDAATISESTLLSDFVTYDSLRFVNLLAALEEEFNCTIDYEAIQNLKSYKEIVELITKLQ